ncbi:DUF4232 domain-containing protein [Cryobacterium sp. SO1]|uniref:DUF4232 domain-containing protein n=1 Tax=Cryobacterium sp. SO1 TaxID=1897061 RepID=UPI0013EEB715|nr:DUF4232 domain-containing protein [Cryobacterium sp. SO1]
MIRAGTGRPARFSALRLGRVLGACRRNGGADRLTPAPQERPGDSGAGSFFWDLRLTNAGDAACTAEGYPSVQLISAATVQSSRVGTPNPIAGCDDPTIQLVRTGALAVDPVIF